LTTCNIGIRHAGRAVASFGGQQLVVVAVDVATLVFGLDGENSVARHNHMVNLCGAAVGLQDNIVEHGVFFWKLSENVIDVKLSVSSFVFGDVLERLPSDEGNE